MRIDDDDPLVDDCSIPEKEQAAKAVKNSSLHDYFWR